MIRLSRRVSRGVAVVSALAALGVTGCDSGDIGVSSAAQSQTYSGTTYQATYYRPAARPQAPVIAGNTVSGKRLVLSSYRGDTIVLNFWGSWCDACREEAPALGALSRKLYPEHVRFIGVDIRDQPDAALAFMQTFRITYPSISDPNDEIALKFRQTVPPYALPDTVVLDGSGRIAASVIGGATYDGLMKLVMRVAAG